MASFLDRCIFRSQGAGLADFIVAAAVTGYMTPAQANVVNAATYHYAAQTVDSIGNIVQWEVGAGAFNTATSTLARTSVLFNSAGNTSKINFSSVPNVMITYLAEDVVTGAAVSTANHAVTFSDTTGRVLADSKVTLTPPATGSTLTIADGKTLTANSSLTLGGTDGETLTVSNSGTLAGGDGFTLAIAAGKTLTASNNLTFSGTDGKSLTLNNSFTFTGVDGSTVAFGSGGTVLYNNPLIIPKTVPSGAAPGAGFCAIQAVAGTNAGTCKIIVYAGTSNTPIVLIDNVGTGF